MRGDDRWLVRLRALLGSAGFIWELGFDHTQRWWIIVACFWLLGGPIESLVKLITEGRIQISVRNEDGGEAKRDQREGENER